MKSKIDKFFGISENNSTIRTEILAGITTFFTMAYIIFANPSILGDALPQGENYEAMKNSIFVATCISAFVGTLMMALYAKLPFAQAPGMGLNAFFAYTIILGMGYTFNQALAAVFLSGILFIIITAFGLRQLIVDGIPENLKHAISAGIGLFIALLGFIKGNIVVDSPATLVQMVDFSNFSAPEAKNALLTVIGVVITAGLMIFKVKGSILIGILVTAIIGIPMGITNISGFSLSKVFSLPPSIEPTLFKFDFKGLLGIGEQNLVGVIFTAITVIIAFSLVDMFDTIGTLIGTSQRTGMLDKDGKLPRMNRALMADAIATSVGACLGTSTVTTYVESGSGIAEGGRTGLTSLVTSILFIVALFFAPLVGLVPDAAVAPALIIVGVLMIGAVRNVKLENMEDALPAFLTIVLMPFTYSIATGIAGGLITYPIMKIFKGKAKEVHPVVYVLAVLFIIRFALITH